MINADKIEAFFDDIVKLTGRCDDIFIVLVTHLVQDRNFFVEALSKIAEVGIIIPKPNSINFIVEAKLEKSFFIHKTTREQISENPIEICKEIDSRRGEKRVLILDIGGYFAKAARFIKSHLGDNFVGIVEDTENGHLRYLESKAFKEVTTFSVARSPLKNTEDFLVGLSICFSADAVMREVNEIYTGRSALVIGYGKIGYSIAKHLAERNINVYVYDINPLRLVEAKSHGHNVLTKEESLNIADVVFCATGQKSIANGDIFRLKNNSIIFTSTSSDDELALSENISDYDKVENISKNITSLTTKRGNTYHLCNSGNAVNFLHGASVGQFIFLVQSEILRSIKSVLEKSGKNVSIYENSEKIQMEIASSWLAFFSSDR